MATHKSAAKRARQSVRKNVVNANRKKTVRTSEKSLLKAIQEKKTTDIPVLLKNFVSEIMKAVNKGVLKKETVSRKIGRVTTRVQKALNL